MVKFCQEVIKLQITLADVLKFDTFKDAHVLTGTTNLNRPVEFNYIIDSFPNLAETVKWLRDDVLVFVLGHSILDQTDKLIEILDMLDGISIPGVVVFVDKYIKSIPENVIQAYLDKGMPLIALPWEVKYLDVSNEIFSTIAKNQLREKEQSDILYQLLFDSSFDRVDILARLEPLSFNTEVRHCILLGDIVKFKRYISSHNLSEPEISKLKNDILNLVHAYFSSLNFNFISMSHNDNTITLLEENEANRLVNSNFEADLNKRLQKLYPGIECTIGIGSSVNKLTDLANSYRQGKNVINAKRSGLVPPGTILYSELGIFQILYAADIETLMHLYPNKIKPIIEYDESHNSNLLETLEIYLDNKNSLTTAAKILYVHKNTILYRIDKIATLIDLNAIDTFTLLFEIKVYKYLRSKQNNNTTK